MGIDIASGSQESTTYTPHLSGLIKISQMFVLHRAVMEAEEVGIKYPAQMLRAMQDRSMVYGSRSTIN